MRKPTIRLCGNKDGDQLCSKCAADQRLCFRHTDSTIPILLKSKNHETSLLLRLYRPVCVGPGRSPKLFFSSTGPNMVISSAVNLAYASQTLNDKVPIGKSVFPDMFLTIIDSKLGFFHLAVFDAISMESK